MKVFRFFLVVLASLLLVLLTTVSLVLIQPDWFKKPLNRLVADQTGLDLTFGKLTTGLKPTRLEADEFRLAYRGETLVSANQVTLTLSDWPSLSAPFFTLKLNAPAFFYTMDDEGRSNWPQSDAPPAPPSEPTALPLPADFAFYSLEIENGQAEIRLPGQARNIKVSNLSLERTAAEKATLTLQTTIDEQTFKVNGDFVLESENQLALNVGLNHEQLETLLQATVSTRPYFDGSRGKLNLSLENTAFLSALLGTKIPELPKATLAADFAIGAHYQLDNVALQLGEQRLNGKATFSPKERHLTASLESPALDIDQLQALFENSETFDEAAEESAEDVEQAITEPGEKGEAAIDWSALSDLALDVDIKVGSLIAQGMSAEQLESHLVLRSENSTPKLALALSGGNLRYDKHALDALAVNAEVHALGKQTEGADAKVTLTAKLNGTVALAANGRANLNGLAGQELELKVDSPNTAELWKIANLPYREAGALAITGTFNSDDKTLTPDLAIALGEQQLDIEARYTDGDRPLLKVIANGRNLDTRFMEAEQTDAPQAAQTAADNAASDEDAPLFSREPIDTTMLRDMDAEISLDIKSLRTGINQIDEVAIIAQLKDGRLTTRNSRVALPESSVDLSLDSQFTDKNTKVRTELLMDSKNLGGLGLDQAAQIRNGHGKVTIKLRTEGLSPHELASALNGTIDVKAQDMVMNNNKVNLIGSDIFSELVGKLNPFAKSDPTTELECVALYFDVKDGIMTSDRAMHVETSKMKIIGKGKVNLRKERLSMNFTPIARKGLGVNLSQVVKLVKLTGPITSPGIGVDAGGLLTSALSTGAAMATGGASLVAQSLIERAANSGSACDPNKKLELDIPEPVQEEPEQEETAPQTGEPARAEAAPG
ncbi:hypothetical protein FHR99_002147 [Litorivivens lipolytica]|uniref:AsmA family protein n=1 Tax=Litorivivens lipolytica TaxID=1524264 RepID=A0A7W4Z7F9_9GAMM|nr:AsmA-like C-terminal region-containing protein [Litorivivens lipolytica]MBB3047881.1 hypothetical protein [Litorivivens lipolytica]